MKPFRQLWADLILLLVTLVWGGTFVMVKGATEDFPVWAFLALRFGLAALVLLPFGWRRIKALSWRDWGAGTLIGLFLLAGYAFQTLGLQYTSASKAGFITGLSVAIVPMISALVLRQKPGMASLMGVALAVIGLALLSFTGVEQISRGDLLVLGCALSFALHIVSVGAFAGRRDPLALTFVQVLTVAVISGGVSLFVDRPWPALPGNTIFAAVFTGVLATALAFLAQTAMQRFTTPTHTALIFTAEPVFAAIFGVLLAGDAMTPQVIVGGILILLGTLISELRWNDEMARGVSRFLAPHYVSMSVIIALGLADPSGVWYGLLWALGLGVPVVGLALLFLQRSMRKGYVSDWHISERAERLQGGMIGVSIVLAGLPLALLLLFDGPRYLLAAFAASLALVIVNTVITLWWKISQHVSGIALGTTLLVGLIGPVASPAIVLVPVVAWARVRVHAHTVLQTIAGGLVGAGLAVAAMAVIGLL